MFLAIASTLLSITVTVPETAHVRGQELHVSSIVRVEGANVPDQARIDALTLGYTPSPGYGRVITRDEIASKLRASARPRRRSTSSTLAPATKLSRLGTCSGFRSRSIWRCVVPIQSPR